MLITRRCLRGCRGPVCLVECKRYLETGSPLFDVCAFQRRLTILLLSLTLPPTTNTHDDSVADKRRRQILCPLQKFQKKNVRIRVKIKKWPTYEVLSEIIIIIRHGHTLIYWFLPLMELVRYKKKKKKNLFTLILTLGHDFFHAH